MRIIMEKPEPEQETEMTVDEQINAVIKILSDANRIWGDDEELKRKLLTARMLIGNLHDEIKNKDNDLVYFSGSPEELMTKQESLNRKKTEKVRCICDSLEEVRDIISLFQSIGYTPEKIISPLEESKKWLKKYAKMMTKNS